MNTIRKLRYTDGFSGWTLRFGGSICWLQVNDAPSERDIHCGRPIVDFELEEHVPDVYLDRLLADMKRCGDLFVAQSQLDPIEHFDFTRGERDIGRVLVQPRLNPRRERTPSGAHVTNDVHEII